MLARVSLVMLVGNYYNQELDYLWTCGLERAFPDPEQNGSGRETIMGGDGIEVELIVGTQTELSGKNKTLLDTFQAKVVELSTELSKAACYNSLFRSCSGDYICVFRPQIFFDTQWMLSLLYHSVNIEKSGICSIAHALSDCKYLPVALADRQEKTIGVFVSEEETITKNSIIFFNRQLLYQVGALDESEKFQDVFWFQYEMRATRLGFTNFFVGNEACVSLLKEDKLSLEQTWILKSQVGKMAKEKRLYIPLDKLE